MGAAPSNSRKMHCSKVLLQSMSPKAIPDKASLPDFLIFPFFLVVTVRMFRIFYRLNMRKIQQQKISPRSKFWGRISRGHPGVIKTSICARTSMTRRRTSTTLRDFQKLRSEKLWAELSFPKNWDDCQGWVWVQPIQDVEGRLSHILEKNLQGLRSWAWLPEFCRTFVVLCEGSSASFYYADPSAEPSCRTQKLRTLLGRTGKSHPWTNASVGGNF